MFSMTYSDQSSRLKITILSLLAVGILSACGIRGPLETPPPLFGGDKKVDDARVPRQDLDKNSDGDEDEFIDTEDDFIRDPVNGSDF